MDSSFTDNSDYEAESRMALVEEYARQPLVRVPRVQELQGSTEEQLPMMMMMNSIFNINKRQIQTNSQESASMCRLDKMKNRILIM